MAEETNTATTDKRLTDEEIAALMGQTVSQMNAVTAPLAPVTPPRNRTYFGPNIAGGGPSPQQFFQDAPTNLLLNRTIVPPVDQTGQVASRIQAATAPESDQAMLSRLQAADRPGTRTLGISRPNLPTQSLGEMQFEAQQGYLRDVNGGMDVMKARDKWMPLMFAGATRGQAWGMTPAQRAANAVALQRVGIAQQGENRRQQALASPANKLSQTGLIDYRNNAARMAQIQKELDVLETKGENLLPEERAKRDNLAKEYLSRMPEGVKAAPMATGTTRAVPQIAPPTAPATGRKGAPSKGEVRNGWRFNGGDPSKKANWEKL